MSNPNPEYKGKSKPLNMELYNKIKKDIYSKYPKHSLFRSASIVKEYKKQGGLFEDTKKSSNKNIDDKVIMKNVTKILSPLKETYEFYEEYEQDECRQEIAYGITNEIFTHCVNILKKHVNESEKDNNNILILVLYIQIYEYIYKLIYNSIYYINLF